MEEKYIEVSIGEGVKRYQVVSGFQDNEKLRKSFNELTGKVFGFSLEDWYQYGYWTGRYCPYALVDQGRVIANVSVNTEDCLVFSEKRRYIQLGTVMTHEDYRGHGLNRILMEIVLKEWEDRCDLFYLYANDSVLTFYPKFGFRESQEYVYWKPFSKDQEMEMPVPEKLDVDVEKDRKLLFDAMASSVQHSAVSMPDNPYMPMFHCMHGKKGSIYSIREKGVIAIASHIGDTLVIHDLYSRDAFMIDEILQTLASDKTRKVRLGFVPGDRSGWEKEVRVEEDATFFVREGKGKLPEEIMFPEMSHA